MKNIFDIKIGWLLFIYIIIDILCTGAGMGVPIFNILFSFFVGWALIKIILIKNNCIIEVLQKSFKYAVWTAFVTFILMLIIWGRTILLLFDDNYDFEKFGHPFILYHPKISFIGWLVLMIFISPILQLLATVFSVNVTLLNRWVKYNTPDKSESSITC